MAGVIDPITKTVNNMFNVFPGAGKGSKSARSIGIVLVNNTNEKLIWDDSFVEHGQRTDGAPAPDEIQLHGLGGWMLESSGMATGCEGRIDWQIEGGEKFRLRYDNPYSGSNSYDSSVYDSRYKVEYSGGGGNNARVVFTLSELYLPTILSLLRTCEHNLWRR